MKLLGAALAALRPKAVQLARLGHAARDRGDWAAARVAYGQAVATNPRHAGTWVQYGHALKESGDVPAAIDAYRRALALQPKSADIHLQLGHALKRGGDRAAAVEAYAQAVALAPDLVDHHLQHGHALRDLGRHDAALAAFQQAAALAPASAEAQFQLGHALNALGQRRPSLEAFRRAAALAPERTETVLMQSRLLHQLGESAAAQALFQQAVAQGGDPAAMDRDLARIRREMAVARFDGHGPPMRVEALRYLMIGTTGLCNASCIHCPTGKEETAAAPRIPMPMPLFTRLIEQVRDLNLTITDQISFGLFGDGLVDPMVLARARLVRQTLPWVNLVVNTNGAAFNRQKHAPLAELVDTLSLHVESLVPATYDRLMAPLRLAHVLPKFDQILAAFPGKVSVSVPVSRLNLEELPAIRAHFMSRGARDVVFDPIASRCRDDDTLFRSLALDPHPVRCGAEVLDDLVVDCDGKVLICCQDFQRREPIGDLASTPLREVLDNVARATVRARFARGEHAELQTCSRCHGDSRAAMDLLVGA